MDGNDTNKLVRGAFLLTLAGIIGKLLSAGYRIPLQNLTGDLGFYIYQQVYPVLGMVMILSLYGFPSAISRLTSEMQYRGKALSIRAFYIPVFLILSSLAIGLFILMYVGAPFLSRWIGDGELEGVYRFSAFAFLLIPVLATGRGVFQGFGDMGPTASSQMAEQFIRVFVIIAAAIGFSVSGGNIYIIGKAAVFASIAAGIVAFFVLNYFFIKRRPFLTGNTYPIPWRFYIKSLLVFGLFFALNHMILLIIQFADAFTLFPGLLQHGMSKTPAMEAKGIFDRGQPFIQLGAVLGSGFSLALIPRISKSRLITEPAMLRSQIQSALSFSTYIAFGATLGLILILPEANQLLYKNTAATGSLQILVTSIVLGSLAITGTSILQGLGNMKVTALFIGCAFFIKWTLNMTLVPLWGIMGGALATVISLFFLTSITFYWLKLKLPQLAFFKKLDWQALITSSLGMIVYLMAIQYIISGFHPETRLGMLVYVTFAVVSGGFIYLFLLLKGKAFSDYELGMLPFGSIFIRIKRGRN